MEEKIIRSLAKERWISLDFSCNYYPISLFSLTEKFFKNIAVLCPKIKNFRGWKFVHNIRISKTIVALISTASSPSLPPFPAFPCLPLHISPPHPPTFFLPFLPLSLPRFNLLKAGWGRVEGNKFILYFEECHLD